MHEMDSLFYFFISLISCLSSPILVADIMNNNQSNRELHQAVDLLERAREAVRAAERRMVSIQSSPTTPVEVRAALLEQLRTNPVL